METHIYMACLSSQGIFKRKAVTNDGAPAREISNNIPNSGYFMVASPKFSVPQMIDLDFGHGLDTG